MGALAGKTAIVTGAGTGIGSAVASVLAEEGARLVLAGRRRAALEDTARNVVACGGIAYVVPTDVTNEDQVTALFAEASRFAPSLDLLVNNAGAFDGGPLEDLSLETWRHVLEVNLTGPFLCIREAFKAMKPRRSGRIINIGSISAQMPRTHSAPYTASKHGLVGLTKAAALEGRDFGISVGCIHPGNVAVERRRTSDSPSDDEPMMTAEELASVVRTMATLPPHVNLLETIILPIGQAYLGRG